MIKNNIENSAHEVVYDSINRSSLVSKETTNRSSYSSKPICAVDRPISDFIQPCGMEKSTPIPEIRVGQRGPDSMAKMPSFNERSRSYRLLRKISDVSLKCDDEKRKSLIRRNSQRTIRSCEKSESTRSLFDGHDTDDPHDQDAIDEP